MSSSLTSGWINNLFRIPNVCSAPNWGKDWESFQVPYNSFAESIFRHRTPCPKPITILNTSAWFISRWACKNYQEAVAEGNQTLMVVSITPQKQVRTSLLSSCCAQVVTEFPISLGYLHWWKSLFTAGSPRNGTQKFWVHSIWKVSSLKKWQAQPCTTMALTPTGFVTPSYLESLPAQFITTTQCHRHSTALCSKLCGQDSIPGATATKDDQGP